MHRNGLLTASFVASCLLGLVPCDDAWAIGAFFAETGAGAPIQMTSSHVAFLPQDGRMTMLVEVAFQGPPAHVAWLIPVPMDPQVTGAPASEPPRVRRVPQLLVDRLLGGTNPNFSLTRLASSTTRTCRIASEEANPPARCYEVAAFHAACERDADCLSGLCSESAGGSMCTQACEEGGPCPEGLECAVWPDASDPPMYACAVPESGPPPPCPDPPPMGSTAALRAMQNVGDWSQYKFQQVAEVVPDDHEWIAAETGEQVIGWLLAQGYAADPSAIPLFADYLARGYRFLGVRLETTAAAGEVMPLAITFDAPSPTPPLALRLTALSAGASLAVIVWYLGSSRAIPRSYLHAILDERAIHFPRGPNYGAAAAAAVAASLGRAWVTEHSGTRAVGFSSFGHPMERDFTAVLHAENLDGLLRAWGPSELDESPEFRGILRQVVPKPPDLHGFPHHECAYASDTTGASCAESNAEHLTTEAEFYDHLEFWAGEEASKQVVLNYDIAVLRQRLLGEIVEPMWEFEDLLGAGLWLTRLATITQPAALTRDAVFELRGALPEVSSWHGVDAEIVAGWPSCTESLVATYDSGETRALGCPPGVCDAAFEVPPLDGLHPLLGLERFPAAGPATPVPLDEVEAADALAALSAASGVHDPESAAPGGEGGSEPGAGSAGCSGGAGWGAAWPAALAVCFGMVALRRRRGREAPR